MEKGLSQREELILNYMKSETQNKGYPPTVREMCKSLGIKSTSTAHKDIENLERKGFIRKDPSKPRAIEILYDTDNTNDTEPLERHDILDLPLVGRVAAGAPILAEENIDDNIPIPARFVGKGAHFLLKIKGDSMIEAGIHDGDYIIVKQQETAVNGDMVVAMIDDLESEATVKTFYKENDYIRLQPENSEMSPIIVSNAKILGLVKGVFRYFS